MKTQLIIADILEDKIGEAKNDPFFKQIEQES